MRLAHIRCVLSRPFGHRWKFVSEHGDDYLRCTECGKRARVGTFRPGSSAAAGHTHADWGSGDGGGD